MKIRRHDRLSLSDGYIFKLFFETPIYSNLSRDLHRILRTVKAISAYKFHHRFLKADDIKQQIMKCNQMLNHSRDIFFVRLLVISEITIFFNIRHPFDILGWSTCGPSFAPSKTDSVIPDQHCIQDIYTSDVLDTCFFFALRITDTRLSTGQSSKWAGRVPGVCRAGNFCAHGARAKVTPAIARRGLYNQP